MNTERKNFIVIDESFVCLNCGVKNPKSGTSCRNHCRNCLFSLHVDEKIPGDRMSKCGKLMKPLYALFDSKKGYMIAHKCACGKISLNKAEKDDNIDLITKLLNSNPLLAGKHEKFRRKNFRKK